MPNEMRTPTCTPHPRALEKNEPRRARAGSVRVFAAILFCAATLAISPPLGAQLLSGEPSFRWENQVDLQYLMGQGVGDSFSGTGLALDYAYQLKPWLWLDLGLNTRQSRCAFISECGTHTGDAAELLAGVKWQWRGRIPVVPYARVGAGPLFLFPSQGKNAEGFGLRGDLGFRYYFMDWLGLGLGFGTTLGEAAYPSTYVGSHVVQVIDLVIGTSFQF